MYKKNRGKRLLLPLMILCIGAYGVTGCGAKSQGLLLEEDTTWQEEGESTPSEAAQDAGSTEAKDLEATDWQVTGSGEFQEPETQLQQTVCIYICGEVNNPGVYTMPSGTRVCDAVEQAGGFTQDAGENCWNLAMLLTDSQMIYIPNKEEAKLYSGQLGAEEPAGPSMGKSQQKEGKVNINTASYQELMNLPGIGESKAKSIVAYRTDHGRFACIEDVMNVAGIKEGLFQKIKEYITT